jgi:hypothetical protein
MKRSTMALAAAAGLGTLTMATTASDPVTAARKVGGLMGKRTVMLPPPGHTDGPGFSDNFDGYTPGPLVPQNGWLYFDGLGAPLPASQNGTVDAALSASAPNSLLAVPETDVVQVFNITSGHWVCKVKTYFPSSVATGTGYFIMMNTYAYPYVGGGNWSIQLDFARTATTAVVRSNNRAAPLGPGTTTLPLIMDQWVEVVVDIDLAADTFNVTYGGAPLVPPNPLNKWSQNVSSAAGAVRIQCIDLYSGIAGFRWDDLSLAQVAGPATCYSNCDSSTNPPCLNVNDFICFNNLFATGDSAANCDGSTNPPLLNVNDFICFNNGYAAGCGANDCAPRP